MLHLKNMLRITLKIIVIVLLIAGLVTIFYYGYPFASKNHAALLNGTEKEFAEMKKLKGYGSKAKAYCRQYGFSANTCFLIDMSLPAGSNRFFVYDLRNDSIMNSGLVAHGSCNETFLKEPKFSNEKGCGCSALGRYKVGYKYNGRFGIAYKLYGLDNSNSNAFDRNIVLHSYYLVPDKEVDPLPICNSLGCAMVSNNYLKKIAQSIDSAGKPLLLWIFQ